jgi:hypothetical protein
VSSQKLILNVLQFSQSVTKKSFHFIAEKKEGYFPIKKEEIPEHLLNKYPAERREKLYKLYTNFQEASDPILNTEIDFETSTGIAKHYYNYLIHNYFKDKVDLIKSNFIYDTEIWITHTKTPNDNYTGYSVFTVKVQFSKITSTPELVISYEGISKIAKKNVTEIGCDTKLYNWVVYEGSLYKYDSMPDEAYYKLENVYPKLRYELYAPLGLPFVPNKDDDKYNTYLKNIKGLFAKFLNTEEFKAVIPITSNNFISVQEGEEKHTSEEMNTLIFGSENPCDDPYEGVKEYGPYSLPTKKHTKFIFIYHKDDEPKYNLLKEWLQGKKNGFKGITTYARLLFSEDTSNNIVFNSVDTIIDEVRDHFFDAKLDADSRYIAFYITPFGSDEKDPVHKLQYYLVKQELLRHRVTSQAMDSNKFNSYNFNFFFPPISVATIAKLGGVPWRLKRDPDKELIVGVGAFKNQEIGQRFIGSAFCFSNDGHFKGFECLPANQPDLLGGSIAKAIRNFKSKNEKAERLIIHFYKSMSYRELKPIEDEINKIEADIPIIIISINKTESKDLVIFDTAYKKLMPLSGTYLSIGDNEYLLCNNTRYPKKEPRVTDGLPFPIKLKFSANKEGIIDNNETIKELIDQVYQFSRMYWKSVRQNGIPVTILYPEMVAQKVPFFENMDVPPFGTENLWFL